MITGTAVSGSNCHVLSSVGKDTGMAPRYPS